MMTPMILAAAIAAAAPAVEPDSTAEREFGLGEVVVTGTRAPKLLKATPVQTRLITAKDIARTDATDIQGLLQQEMPGVEFTYAMNQQTHINFGGFGGQSVLFLVDGERLAGETMDDVDFSRLTMAGVERIEIVRGASSALYGSSAAGGVINIITREPRRPWSVSADARIGRHADQRYGLTATLRRGTVSNALSATYSRINSYNVTSAPDPSARVVTTIYGNRTLNVSDRFAVSPVDGLKLSARAGYFFREIPRVTDTPERYRDYSAGLRALWQVSDAGNIDVAYSFDQYDKSDFRRISGLDVRSYSNALSSLRGVFNYTLGRGDVLTLGADWRHDYLMNTKLATGSKRETNVDAFAQYDWIIDPRWEAVGAVRYDWFSDGDGLSRVTPKLSLRYTPRRNLNLRLAYGMGFRAPTLKEKYYDFDMAGIWIVRGNPALKPEMSHNINASADWTRGAYNVTLTGYYNHVTDRIATGLPYALPSDPRQLYLDYVNLATYRVAGAEATLQARWRCGISARLSYAYTREMTARDKEGNEANNQYIPARRHSLTARADWTREFSKNYSLTVGINGRVLSGVTNREYKDYYDIAAGTVAVSYPAYTLWRLSASQLFGSRVRLTLTLDNLFNYRPKYYYLNAPLTDGLTFQAGISINID